MKPGGVAPLTSPDNVQAITLNLGSFDLVGEGPHWLCEALAEGTDLAGNPVPVDVAIQTLIQDGSVSYTEKYDNATITIRVCLSGPDAEGLDDAAAALFAELGKQNVLTYTGPQAAEAIAWDVVNSKLERNSDDLAEVRGERYYTITLTVLPFRRAISETVTEALVPNTSTTTLVDACSSATGWSGFANGVPVTPTSSSGKVSLYWIIASDADDIVKQPQVFSLVRTGAIDTSVLPMIAVDWRIEAAQIGSSDFVTGALYNNLTAAPSVQGGSSTPEGNIQYTRIAEQASPTAGYTRTWFRVNAASVSSGITFTATLNSPIGFPLSIQARLLIDKVDKTDVPPMIGPGQQLLRSIPIEGSARTPGSIAIEHETAALGTVLAYFWKDDHSGYAPPLSPWRTAGTFTADTSYVSGGRVTLGSVTAVYDIPVSRLPRDGYLLAIRAAGGPGTITWTATTRVNGVDLGPTLTGSQTLTLVSQSVVPLAALQLPTRDVDEAGIATAIVRVTVTASAAFDMDEVWLYRDSGQLVQVECGTGTPSSGGPSNRLFIDPPTLTRPRAVVRRGFAADRSDSFHPPTLGSWEFPEFPPPLVNAHVVTTDTTGAALSFRHYKRLAG